MKPLAPDPALADGLAMPRRIAAVVTLCLAVFMTVLDGSMITVALPILAEELHINAALSVWIVNAYQLTIVVSILPAVVLADRYGYARLFRLGVCLYTGAALASASATGFESLIAARCLQGLGSAGILCGSSALLRAAYPARLFSTGIALNTTVATLSAASGPTLGSLVLTLGGDWRWLFLVFLPFGLLCALCALGLPHIARRPRRLQAISLVLNVLALGLGILGLSLLGRQPLWGVALVVSTAIVWRVWIRHEAAQTEPLLPLDLFRLPRFSFAIAASVSMFAAQAASLVALPFHFQQAWQLDIMTTGMLLTLWPACGALTSTQSIRLLQRYSVATLCATGAALLMLGLLWIALLPVSVSPYWLLPGLALGGIAVGIFQAPNMHAILTAGPKSRAGPAGSIQAIARVGGGTLGGSLVGLCFALAVSHTTVVALSAAMALAAIACGINLARHHRLATEPNA